MAIQYRPASAGNAKPVIGIYSESGAGKTYSALALARGFVGPKGIICMIETESGRGEALANEPLFFGDRGAPGYDVISLADNFAPQEYHAAIKLAESKGANALIIDSASHEWEGVGGVLDQAAERSKTMKGPLVWQKPKIDHSKFFVLPMLQTKIDLVVCCMRAKYPMEEGKNAKGEKEWRRSQQLEPKQSEDILFEMFVHGWIEREGDTHNFRGTKYTLPELREVIKSGEPISLETGRRLAAWARGDKAKPPAPAQAQAGAATATKTRLQIAEERTAEGAENFKAWMNARTREWREELQPHFERLRKMATEADAKRGPGPLV